MSAGGISATKDVFGSALAETPAREAPKPARVEALRKLRRDKFVSFINF